VGPRSPRPCGLPGPTRVGSPVLLGLAPDGVWPAAASPRRRCALTAPFHLCLRAAHVLPRHRPYVSVPLSRGFPRVGVTHRPTLWCPDFPRGTYPPRPRGLRPRSYAACPPRSSPPSRSQGARRRLGQLRTAGSAATGRREPLPAHRAAGVHLGCEIVPGRRDQLLERRPAGLEQALAPDVPPVAEFGAAPILTGPRRRGCGESGQLRPSERLPRPDRGARPRSSQSARTPGSRARGELPPPPGRTA